MKKFVLGVLALGLAFPVTAMAQDDDDDDRDAAILMISSYQCPNSAIAGITADYNENTKPVEQEVIAEGMMESTGLFFHAWADEWNVNYYRTGYDIGEMIDAIAEVGSRIAAANPDAGDGAFAACTAHKDNIYFFGPNTGDDDDDGDDGGN